MRVGPELDLKELSQLISAAIGGIDGDDRLDIVTCGMSSFLPFDRMGRVTLWKTVLLTDDSFRWRYCSTCATHFCSMKITEDVRKYPVEQGLTVQQSLEKGIEAKSREFPDNESELDAKA